MAKDSHSYACFSHVNADLVRDSVECYVCQLCWRFVEKQNDFAQQTKMETHSFPYFCAEQVYLRRVECYVHKELTTYTITRGLYPIDASKSCCINTDSVAVNPSFRSPNDVILEL